MVSIHVKAHVGADGRLKLQVPTGFRETELEVLLVLNPVHPPASLTRSEQLGWPAEYFERTFGSCQDEPLVRLPQGEPEDREALR